MRRIIKWIGIVLGGIVLLILVILDGLVLYGQFSFKRAIDRPVYEISADTSPTSLARGEY